MFGIVFNGGKNSGQIGKHSLLALSAIVAVTVDSNQSV
jgi:hypothetical protein